jgi:hypothetical protein
MPIYRKPSEEIDELHLPTQPDCVVKMKRRATRGDYIDAESYVILTRGQEKQAWPEGFSDQYTVALWEALTLGLIVEWNLEDEDGVWPFEFRSLRQLDPIDGAFLELETRKRVDTADGPFGSTLEQPSRDMPSKTDESEQPSTSTFSHGNSAGRHRLSEPNGKRISRALPSSPNTAGN